MGGPSRDRCASLRGKVAASLARAGRTAGRAPRWIARLATGAIIWAAAVGASAQESGSLLPRATIGQRLGTFRLVQDTPAPAPQQPAGTGPPIREFSPQLDTNLPSFSDDLGFQFGEPSVESPTVLRTGSDSPFSQYTTDPGQWLHEDNTIQSVEVQRRSPVSLDPHIRGYHVGQIYTQADGALWIPARQDLDTILNKIDPATIRELIITPGPFGVQYGPGLSFIDVIQTTTPRYQDGPEIHGTTSGTFRNNGKQWYNRQSFYGGSNDYGFRFAYGNRNGVDYVSGNSQKIPNNYRNQDFVGNFGYDINPNQHLEFAYNRLDQVNTEIPLQFFDINYLGTDAFNLRLVDDDPCGPWSRLVIGGWNNRTRFDGDTRNKSNPSFPVIPRVEAALADNLGFPGVPMVLEGTTEGNVQSSGGRVAFTFGDEQDLRLSLGGDYRYVQQAINEQYSSDSADPGLQAALVADDLASFGTNLPNSFFNDPGIFSELAIPITPFWTTSVGMRLDWVTTTARASDLRANTSLPGNQFPGDDLNQSDFLYAFFLTNDLELDRNFTLRVGGGYAQRPPTLTERYADGLFLGVIQSGFTRVIGDPNLDKESAWQLDASIVADYDRFRGRMTFFNAWIGDYITFFDDNVPNLTGARLLQYTNTSLATLIGGEMALEFDAGDYLTPFATAAYVDGRDRQIHAPLPQISPLDSRMGVRLHGAEGSRPWSIECGTRLVARQDRLGTIRLGGGGAVTPVETPTAGFTVYYIRANASPSDRCNVFAGIENIFDRNYLEHLDLRLGPQAIGNFGPLAVLSPGFAPYFGLEWIY